MRTYIKKIQSKTENTRKQIFFWSLVICMSFVCFIWVSSFSHKISSEKSVAKTQEDVKPFALFGKTIKDTYNNITASVGNISLIKKNLSEQTEEIPKVESPKTEKQIDLIPLEYNQ